MSWTDERIDRLKSLWMQGMTASQIAEELGGVSRNAVIGKIHRLGLSPGRRPAALARQMRTSPARVQGPPTRITRIFQAIATQAPSPLAAKTVEAPPVESSQRCSLLELAGGRCRWPISDPGKDDFGFCGNESIGGFSYCVGHARIAYRLPSGRRAQG